MTSTRIRRILIVDDNEAIHKDFRKIFSGDVSDNEMAQFEAELFGAVTSPTSHYRYELTYAFQGQEALELVARSLAEEQPFEMAFVDMRMPPGWDGAETIERIWEVDPGLQVVICTAYSDYSWTELFQRLDGRDRLLVLKKPFDNVEVEQLAAALTEKRALWEEAIRKQDELEELVRERTRKLEQRDQLLRQKQKMEAVGSLADGIAHEFNNLLQIISGYTKFAMGELPSESQAYNDLSAALDASDKAVSLTRQLLDFSRSDDAHRETYHVNASIKKTVELLQPIIGKKHDIDVRIGASRDQLFGNRCMLEQSLMNLLLNGRDAMQEGGTLSIATDELEVSDDREGTASELPTGSYVKISVIDTGSGMDEHTRARIFDPFFTTKEEGKGTGLGLSLVYGCVEHHNGVIRVESRVGAGTTFELILPIHETQADVPDRDANVLDIPDLLCPSPSAAP